MSARPLVVVPSTMGKVSRIFVICVRYFATSCLSVGLSSLCVGGSSARWARRHAGHCVVLHAVHLWRPIVALLHMPQENCSVSISSCARHSVQPFDSSADSSRLSVCFASALMLRQWMELSEMWHVCGLGLYRRLRCVSTSPLLRPLYFATPSRRSRSNL